MGRTITQIREFTEAMKRDYFLKRLTFLGLGALCVIQFHGCTWLESVILPTPPESEIAPAVIRSRSILRREKGDSISIKAVDRRPPTLLEYKWVVAPGPHVLDVEVEFYEESERVKDRTYVTKAKRDIVLVATPGADYVVDAKKVESIIYIWVSDIQSGKVVAGEAPHGNTLPGFDRGIEKGVTLGGGS